jgi:predicted nucleic acid-binding Zn ribbon protein
MEYGDNQRSIKDLIQNWLRTTERKNGYQEARIAGLWKDVMGQAVDRHTKRVRFRDGTLTVHLDSAVLREELSMGKGKIVSHLNERMGEAVIEEIVLR